MAVLVALSVVALCALFLTSWLIYMPVVALLVAPVTILGGAVAGAPPSALLNSVAALALSGSLACATVALVLRVLLRRARTRRLRAKPGAERPVGAAPVRAGP